MVYIPTFNLSSHYPLGSNPSQFRTGTEMMPISNYQGIYRIHSSAAINAGGPTVGYYNSGFLSGLGGVLKNVGPYIAAAGSIAAEVLPAIYHTGTSGAAQAPAAGPTAAPTMSKPTSLVGKIAQAAAHPITATIQDITMGGAPSTVRGRYGTPGEKGFHMIKRGPHAGMWVRNRHRNVANIHALRRSLSRIHGFEKICRKVVHFVHPKRAVGHAVFKKARRR